MPQKTLSLKEFRDLGFLQEINRRILHPCGLALAIASKDSEDGSFGCVIWDGRDSDVGFVFQADEISLEKADSVSTLILSKKEDREDILGSYIQPLTNGPLS